MIFASARGYFGALWARVEVLTAAIRLGISVYPSGCETGVTYREYAVLQSFRVSHRPALSRSLFFFDRILTTTFAKLLGPARTSSDKASASLVVALNRPVPRCLGSEGLHVDPLLRREALGIRGKVHREAPPVPRSRDP